MRLTACCVVCRQGVAAGWELNWGVQEQAAHADGLSATRGAAHPAGEQHCTFASMLYKPWCMYVACGQCARPLGKQPPRPSTGA